MCQLPTNYSNKSRDRGACRASGYTTAVFLVGTLIKVFSFGHSYEYMIKGMIYSSKLCNISCTKHSRLCWLKKYYLYIHLLYIYTYISIDNEIPLLRVIVLLTFWVLRWRSTVLATWAERSAAFNLVSSSDTFLLSTESWRLTSSGYE